MSRKSVPLAMSRGRIKLAIRSYARRHNLSVATVRDVSSLRFKAIREYKAKRTKTRGRR